MMLQWHAVMHEDHDIYFRVAIGLGKKSSRERRLTLGQVIEEALRNTLAGRPKSSARSNSPALITFEGSGLWEGVDLDSSASLLDVMESDR
jgi:hypothetical protein